MSRIMFPTIAATCVALYFISRKRKVEIELEIEPVEDAPKMDSAMTDAVLMAE